MTAPYRHEEFTQRIQDASEKKDLVVLGLLNEGGIRIKYISPEQYGNNCVALAKKLGFPVTTKRLHAEAELLKRQP